MQSQPSSFPAGLPATTASSDIANSGSVNETPFFHWLGHRIRQIPTDLVAIMVNTDTSINGFIPTATLSTWVTLALTGNISLFTAALSFVDVLIVKRYLNRAIENQALKIIAPDYNDQKIQLTSKEIETVCRLVKCSQPIIDRLISAFENKSISKNQLKFLISFFRRLVKQKEITEIELNKTRYILNAVPDNPELFVIIVTMAACTLNICSDRHVDILDRMYSTAFSNNTLGLFEGSTIDWEKLLTAIQIQYNETVFLEVMLEIGYGKESTGHKFPENNLLNDPVSTYIHIILKRIFHEAGVCEFSSEPSRIECSHSFNTAFAKFSISSETFYMFEAIFIERLHDHSSFEKFVLSIISACKDNIITNDPQLKSNLEDLSSEMYARLDLLSTTLDNGSINEGEYEKKMKDLMNKRNESIDKMWSTYISKKIYAHTKITKNPVLNKKVIPGLSMEELLALYNP